MSAPSIGSPLPLPASDALLDAVAALGSHVASIRAETSRIIFGQQEAVDQTLITLLCGGHVLLVGVPGLGKSKLVETLATVLGLASKRVQFTPDLMPADILGSEVLDEDAEGRRSFRFIAGPVFTQLLMADEINRASPRTQSALLQAMQENRVAVAGVEHALPRPFHVLATQNPIEQEGTYPLPEAQLDRFLLQVDMTYPDQAAERTMLLATTPRSARASPPVAGGRAAARRAASGSMRSRPRYSVPGAARPRTRASGRGTPPVAASAPPGRAALRAAARTPPRPPPGPG